MRPVAVDLFSGVGGLGLGFEQAGFDVSLSVEYALTAKGKPYTNTANLHSINFPQGHCLFKDVSVLTGDRVREFTSSVDCIVGGPPCQPFSMEGKRDKSDSRRGLPFEFLRVVGEVLPRYFVMENVEGLLSIQDDGTLLTEKIIRYAESLGYRCDWWKLNASHYGVPQERIRVFIVGALQGQPFPAKPAPLDERFVVRDAIADLQSLVSIAEEDTSEPVLIQHCLLGRSEIVKRKKKRKDKKLEDSRVVYPKVEPGSYAHRMRDSWEYDYSYPRRYPASWGGFSASTHSQEVRQRFLNADPWTRIHPGRYPKLGWDRPCNTLKAGSLLSRHTALRPVHPEEPRLLVVRELARLSGFPDWFQFSPEIYHGCREIGNAVPPPLARAVAGSLLEAMGVKPERPSSAAIAAKVADLPLFRELELA